VNVLCERAFDCVKSEHKLQLFCKQSLGMVEPEEHILGFDDKGRKDSFQYIPLLKLLKFLLSQDEVTENIAKQNETKRTESNLLQDFCDGTICKNHPVLSSKSSCLTIHLYNDEFEVVNPFGSKKLKHKESAYYFFLGNLAPKF
jgi:hypothetical protein